MALPDDVKGECAVVGRIRLGPMPQEPDMSEQAPEYANTWAEQLARYEPFTHNDIPKQPVDPPREATMSTDIDQEIRRIDTTLRDARAAFAKLSTVDPEEAAERIRNLGVAFRDDRPADSASARQVGGDHYKNMKIEPWDVVDTWPLEQRVGAYRYASLKYIMRLGSKDERLGEAMKGGHCTEKLVETLAIGEP